MTKETVNEVRQRIFIHKKEFVAEYHFPDTEVGREVLRELRNLMNTNNLYFHTLFANTQIIRVYEDPSYNFVNEFIEASVLGIKQD